MIGVNIKKIIFNLEKEKEAAIIDSLFLLRCLVKKLLIS
jgi:hypothetical protein